MLQIVFSIAAVLLMTLSYSLQDGSDHFPLSLCIVLNNTDFRAKTVGGFCKIVDQFGVTSQIGVTIALGENKPIARRCLTISISENGV